VAVHVASDGSQTSELIFQCGVEPGTCAGVPIDLGPESEQVILLLFGTGIRGAGSDRVAARIAGVNADVQYAGPQPTYAGLDQVNVLLPRSLAGSGEVEIALEAEGKPANAVTVFVK
jgi:uncharacterized protein (TIGR03437 family)